MPEMSVADECPIHFDPLAPDQLADPYPVYADMRLHEPVHFEPDLDLWVITRHRDVVAAALETNAFSSIGSVQTTTEPYPDEVQRVLADGIGDMVWMTASDDPEHRRVRSMVNKVFTPSRVRELEPLIEHYVNALIDEFAADGETDIVESFAWPLPLWGLAEILGLPRSDIDQLHVWSYDWLRLMQATDPTDDLVTYAEHFVALQRYVLAALEEREIRPRDDLLSALAEARRHADPPLTLVETAWIPINLIVAGHVTVTRAIANGLAVLFDHPERLADLTGGGDGDLLAATVEEMLRYESPAQGLFRITKRPVEVDGVEIPAGAKVMIHFGSANRDEHVFVEPERFMPERNDLRSHLAFGKGVHFCVGAPLARAELRHSFRGLLDRLPNLRPGGEGVRDTIFFARGWSRLPVAWDPPR